MIANAQKEIEAIELECSEKIRELANKYYAEKIAPWLNEIHGKLYAINGTWWIDAANNRIEDWDVENAIFNTELGKEAYAILNCNVQEARAASFANYMDAAQPKPRAAYDARARKEQENE